MSIFATPSTYKFESMFVQFPVLTGTGHFIYEATNIMTTQLSTAFSAKCQTVDGILVMPFKSVEQASCSVKREMCVRCKAAIWYEKAFELPLH